MERGVPSFRHPERSRGIFFVSRFRFLRNAVCMKHRSLPDGVSLESTVLPARRYPHILCLTAFPSSIVITISGVLPVFAKYIEFLNRYVQANAVDFSSVISFAFLASDVVSVEFFAKPKS